MGGALQWGNLTDTEIKDILLVEDYVTKDDVAKFEVAAKQHYESLIDVLLQQKVITSELVGQAIAEFYSVPFADLNARPPTRENILKIPEEVAKKLHVVVFEVEDNTVVVATDNPSDSGIKSGLIEVLKTDSIKLNYAPTQAIETTFVAYRKSLETRFSKIIQSEGRVAPEIIDEIFDDAFTFRASDIHLEPREKEVVVRFRIDGVLHDAGRIEKSVYEAIVNRIKVLGHIRTDKHFDALDGTIHWEKKDAIVDMRISIVPLLDGEKIVIRLLSSYVKGLSLSDLGLSTQDQETVSATAKKPFGMILASGPTGAGKTTTMYAILEILNHPEVNITTIEDPVEYHLTGANQIQVNADTKLTFARGLRSIVRQDPNIILVGEIRDMETAEIAVNAALTGHLLLSSFHSNDAATTIPRMLNMGIEPFLLASTLELVVSQRLVRRICETCRYGVSMTLKDLTAKFPEANRFFPAATMTMYKSKGCNACGNTGYLGRIAIFEIIRITKEIEEAILKQSTAAEIWRIAEGQGSKSLFEDGVEKVKSGITDIDELLRVAAPPEDIPKTHEKSAKAS